MKVYYFTIELASGQKEFPFENYNKENFELTTT
jgi:hypothetical protein